MRAIYKSHKYEVHTLNLKSGCVSFMGQSMLVPIAECEIYAKDNAGNFIIIQLIQNENSSNKTK